MDSVQALKARNRIRDEIPLLDDLLDPAVEREDADSEEIDNFASGDKGLEEIVRYIQKKQSGGADDDNDDDDEVGPTFDLDFSKALEAAQLLELICVNCGDLECSLDLGRVLRKFRGEIRREQEAGKKQVRIGQFFVQK